MFNQIRKFFRDNKQHLTPAINFSKRCLSDVVEMREKPNYIDYFKLGFSFKENWDNAYNLNDPYTYFGNNPGWRFISGGMMGAMLCNLVIASQTTRMSPIAAVDAVAAFSGDVEGARFGWVMYDDQADKLYVTKDAMENYSKALETMFWKKYSCNHVVLGIQDEEKITISEDVDSKDFLTSERAAEACRDIQKFLDKGINRSIIYYGPPGSGKSNMVKNISTMLNLRTIRINNLSKFSVEIVLEILRIFNPDAVILEDIDNVATEEISDILDKVERFNRHHKVIFATANQIGKLDEALVRPGRFDEPIEIKTLDEKIILNMVNHDEEIFNIVQEWPAAYTIELMKRVQVRGREIALANYEDITDRIENLQDANYELKNHSMDSDEDMFD